MPCLCPTLIMMVILNTILIGCLNFDSITMFNMMLSLCMMYIPYLLLPFTFFFLVWHAPKGLPQDIKVFFSIQCIVKDLNALGVLSHFLHLNVKGACESSGMGLGWTPRVELMDIWKCINQKKRAICAFGTKLGHKVI